MKYEKNGKYEGLSVFAFGEVGLVASVGVKRRPGGEAVSCEVYLHGAGGSRIC